MRILGLSAFYNDSAAALVEDGRLVAAAQEERFSRRKHDPGFPRQAMDYCLAAAGCTLETVDAVVLDRPRDRAGGAFERRWRPQIIDRRLAQGAAAFFPSPFDAAAVLIVDGDGDGGAAAATSLARGIGNRLEIVETFGGAHSLGRLISAVTGYLGFKAHSGEYKVMGLAPYGEPRYAQVLLERVLHLGESGDFHLDPALFDPSGDEGAFDRAFTALFGPSPRGAGPLTAFHMDLAASLQAATERVLLALARTARARTGARHLCLAGEVALNCVANGKVLSGGLFDGLWIQPAAGDAGGAVGAALAGYHLTANGARRADGRRDAMQGALLGPEYGQAEIESRLSAAGARFTVLAEAPLVEAVAAALAEGQVVGWMQGRMEFGPRALGGRSILGDPRAPAMQALLNAKVKYRENFRPFAPSVLVEDAADWFELAGDSPYMLLAVPVHIHRRRSLSAADQALSGLDRLGVVRSVIPAVTHVDWTSRVQTVDGAGNPRFHALLRRFKALTGCPVLVNTSFNVRGEPIVCTPEDAFRCFMGSGIDRLAVGNCLLVKEDQDPALLTDTAEAFEPD